MKVICNRGALLEALMVTSNVVAARTPKPVLQCVKLTAADDRLTVACGDDAIRILELQRAGGKLMKADEFLRGTPLKPPQRIA